MDHPEVRHDLAEVALDNPATLLALFIAHDDALTEFVADSDALNTDDLPLLEYGLPLCTEFSGLENLEAMTQLQQSVLTIVDNISDEQAAQLDARQRSQQLLREGLIAISRRRPDEAIERWRQAVQLDPDNHEARDALEDFVRKLLPNQTLDAP
jgi:tetratricopeptide (TPR) repeat protein